MFILFFSFLLRESSGLRLRWGKKLGGRGGRKEGRKAGLKEAYSSTGYSARTGQDRTGQDRMGRMGRACKREGRLEKFQPDILLGVLGQLTVRVPASYGTALYRLVTAA